MKCTASVSVSVLNDSPVSIFLSVHVKHHFVLPKASCFPRTISPANPSINYIIGASNLTLVAMVVRSKCLHVI